MATAFDFVEDTPVASKEFDFRPDLESSPTERAVIPSPGELPPKVFTRGTPEIVPGVTGTPWEQEQMRTVSTVPTQEEIRQRYESRQIPFLNRPTGTEKEITLPEIGEPGTLARGITEPAMGVASWALNNPDEFLASVWPPTRAAVIARYAPEIATQVVGDVGRAFKGDKQALGRVIGVAALVLGPKGIESARARYLTQGKPAVMPIPPDVAALSALDPRTVGETRLPQPEITMEPTGVGRGRVMLPKARELTPTEAENAVGLEKLSAEDNALIAKAGEVLPQAAAEVANPIITEPTPPPEPPPTAPEVKVPEPTAPDKVEAPAAKEPWQMTSAEYERSVPVPSDFDFDPRTVTLKVSGNRLFNEPMSLESAMAAPALFDKFPFLRDIKVEGGPTQESGHGAYYDPKTKTITVGVFHEVAAENALRHEIQHAIDDHLGRGQREQIAGKVGDWLSKARGDALLEHEDAVRSALAQGKAVPPEVLAQYPDLAPKPAAKPAAETGKEMGEPSRTKAQLVDEILGPKPVQNVANVTARIRWEADAKNLLKRSKEELQGIAAYKKIFDAREAQISEATKGIIGDVVYRVSRSIAERRRVTQPNPPETPPIGPGMEQPATPEARLSQSLQGVPKQKPIPQEPAAQPLGITPFPGLVTGLQKIAQSAQKVWHEIADVPEFKPFKRVINKFNGDNQRTSLKIRQMQSDIESRVPDPTRREAITNWLQADGDPAKLQTWAVGSRNAKRRAGYIAAQHLTPYEVQVARAIRQYYDDLFSRANAYGILDQAKADYVTQIWKRPLLGGAQFAQFASKLARTFKFGLKSTFENFAEGEQAGFKPLTKDISKILGIYVSELEKTIATRDMIKNLAHETASDGNPLAKVEGVAHIAEDQAGDPTGPMFVRPGVVKGDVRYAELNHPALKNWKWVSKDPESGRDVFILGELRVHPEIRRHLSNVLSNSQINKWMREPSESELGNILRVAARAGDTTSKVVKQTMLGTLSMFHHVQEGTHAVGHRANAFLPPKLPVGTPELNYALDHGLQVAGDRAALENFREGLGAHGVFAEVPLLGKWIEKHNDLLFNEYIPRLKWDTWQRIYSRNLARYRNEINRGEITPDDVAYLSSKQTNAAFGHQNYTDLGRNATVQHVLRIFALAPDFLEARTRFTGQALQGAISKVGREQLEALGLLGGLFYVGARIGNKLSDDDWHLEEPFRVRYSNRWYGMRSVPEDVWRAFNDTRMFAYNRLNPVFGRPLVELMSGVNYRGEKIPASEVFKNALVSGVPIQMRDLPPFKSLTETQRNATITAWEQFLSSMGVQVSRYSPLNQTYKLASRWRKSQGEKEAPTTYPVSKYQKLRYALEDHDLSLATDELLKLTESGKIPLLKIAEGFRVSLHRPFSGSVANEAKLVSSLNPDQKSLYKEAVAQRRRVWNEFVNAEKEFHRRQREGK